VEENKIKPTIVIPTEVRLVFPKLESIEFSGMIFAPWTVARCSSYCLCTFKTFCGNISHFYHFLRNESRPDESPSPILFSTD
jgi:hypothetical protein